MVVVVVEVVVVDVVSVSVVVEVEVVDKTVTVGSMLEEPGSGIQGSCCSVTHRQAASLKK